MEYIEHPSGSLVVQTAWAVLGLLEGGYPDPEPMRRGVRLLMDRQQSNGEWLQEAIEGVFNKSGMISYPNYKFQFPIKAMGMFARRFPDVAAEMGVEKVEAVKGYKEADNEGMRRRIKQDE